MTTKEKTGQRCPGFSGEEKVLIATVCAKYKHIIENQKTDHVSNEAKNKIWEKIATEVNATAVNATHRTSEALKRFYENRKREVRKIVAEEKHQVFATGGGPCKI
ncbi:hypothetical protein D910_09057 [Dendroctonus ponderosae]|uniref:Regulatory protein zeste n=1 Tax=Dendroctonus ponderosae TaxID=77166 RepID=U4UNX4_DENPD|nr:hypothetical protein D910_09057 [Dendroctonus ponderosae]